MTGVIGKIKSEKWEAILQKNGTWKSEQPQVEKYLNLRFNPRETYSPADGVFGFACLHDAAKESGAKVVYQMKPPPFDPKAIY